MRLALLFSFCLMAVPAHAQDTPLVKLQTGDDSKGWNAVGRLNLGQHGFCSGALIAPDLVLTAAHCLYDKTTGAKIDAGDIEFQAGLRNGRAEAYRKAAIAVAHPDYIYSGAEDLERVAFDIALIKLDNPIRQPSIQPFATAARPQIGDQVGVVSYAQDRADAPSLQQACHVIDADPTVLVLNCDVDFGSSGAPIFSIQNGVAKIVSVVSAKAEVDGNKVALGTALEDPLAVVMAELAKGGASVALAGKRVNLLSGGKSTGAKFIKP